MRARLPVIAMLAALLGLLPPGPALAQRTREAPVSPQAAPNVAPQGALGDREATIANRTALSITQVFISPNSTDAWGDDRLGDAILEPGRTLRLRLGRLRDCAFDLLVIYEDDSREERTAHNLCRTRQVAFDGKARIWPTVVPLQLREMTLSNQSARAIQQVFISAADAAQWGEDLLPQAISVGESSQIAFRGGCTVDIRVVFENRAAEESRGIDLCRRATISIEPGWTTRDDIPPPA